jgi:hypothetical protein
MEKEIDTGPRTPSFWTTIPGILTGIAGLVTALLGVIAFFHSRSATDEKTSPSTPSGTPSASAEVKREDRLVVLGAPSRGQPQPPTPRGSSGADAKASGASPTPATPSASSASSPLVSSPSPVVPTAAATSRTPARPDPASASFRVVEAMLRADPFEYHGSCPVTITFSGRISVAGGRGTVSYKFLRSDGASAPVESLVFEAPGSKDVSTTWRLGGPGFAYSGWQAIQIFDPEDVKSKQANFMIQCSP